MLQSNPQTVTQQKNAERLIVEFSLENFSKVSFKPNKYHYAYSCLVISMLYNNVLFV